MQLTNTIFPDSTVFIEKKTLENRLWAKSDFGGKTNASSRCAGNLKIIWQASDSDDYDLHDPKSAWRGKSHSLQYIYDSWLCWWKF